MITDPLITGLGPILLIDTDQDVPALRAAFAQLWPEVQVVEAGEVTDPATVRVCVTWRPRPGALAAYPRLSLVIVAAAGADGALAPGAVPSGVQVARLIDPAQAHGMAEFVLAQVLAVQKRLPEYRRQQRAQTWTRLPQRPAAEVVVAQLGYGHIGRQVAESLRLHGYPVRVWARTARVSEDPGLQFFHGQDQLAEAVAPAAVVVSLLPHTAATQGLLDACLFQAMAPGAFVVNVGRGSQLVAEDLIAALDRGHLSGACLDVQPQEPLPPGHPLWSHPDVVITPHIASDITVSDSVRRVRETVERFMREGTAPGLVDPARGY